MTRRRGPTRQPGVIDPDAPILDVLKGETKKSADELQDALNSLGGLADGAVKIIVQKINKAGKGEYCRTLSPPVILEDLAEDLKDEFGPGEYTWRIMVDGQLRTWKTFSIAAARNAQVPARAADADTTKMLLEQSDKSRSEQGNIFGMMMTMMQNSSNQMMQMMQANAQQQMQSSQQSNQMMVAMMTAMMGNKDDPAKSFASIAELVKAMSSPPTSMQETLAVYSQLKALSAPDKAEGDGGIMEMAKSILPGLGAMAAETIKGMKAGGEAAPPHALTFRGAPGGAIAAPLDRQPPPPVPGASRAQPANDAAPRPAAAQGGFEYAEGVEPNPVLALIRPDVLYFMSRQHDPELTADALGDIFDAHGVTKEDVYAIGLALQATGEQWPQVLAQQGIDVTDHREWFEKVLFELVARYSEPADDDEAGDLDGAGGGRTDVGPDADPSAVGGAGSAGQEPSRRPNGQFAAKRLQG